MSTSWADKAAAAKHLPEAPRAPMPVPDDALVEVWYPNPYSGNGDRSMSKIPVSRSDTTLHLKQRLFVNKMIGGELCNWAIQVVGEEGASEGMATKVFTPKPLNLRSKYEAVYLGPEVVSAQAATGVPHTEGTAPPLYREDFHIFLPEGTKRVLVADTNVLFDIFIRGATPRGMPDLPCPGTYCVYNEQVAREIEAQRYRFVLPWPSRNEMKERGAHFLPLPGADAMRYEQIWQRWFPEVMGGRECTVRTDEGELVTSTFPLSLAQHINSRNDQNDHYVFLDALLLAHCSSALGPAMLVDLWPTHLLPPTDLRVQTSEAPVEVVFVTCDKGFYRSVTEYAAVSGSATGILSAFVSEMDQRFLTKQLLESTAP